MDEYSNWMKTCLSLSLTNVQKQHYESVVEKARSTFLRSSFWIELNRRLPELNSEFRLIDGYDLLLRNAEPDLDVKSYDSFLLKTFRRNCLDNKAWPTEPTGGWMIPSSWHSRINDVIRTRYIVKYLDGVEFLANRIAKIATENGLEPRIDFETKAEGYYAAHLYVTPTFEVPAISWDTEYIQLSIEIQITTQLQEVILKLLHEHYEQRRKKSGLESMKWQWDYRSGEFASNYLGHILHYVEGMIAEIRHKRTEET